jgi:predicted protein tyrosine phosphatase
VKNVLFVCSQNKLRSPTAEQVFANWPEIEVSSAFIFLMITISWTPRSCNC